MSGLFGPPVPGGAAARRAVELVRRDGRARAELAGGGRTRTERRRAETRAPAFIPARWDLFDPTAPPWLVSKAAILGVPRGAAVPEPPPFVEPARGHVPEVSNRGNRAIVDSRLAAGLQLWDAEGRGFWDTQAEKMLRAVADRFDSWRVEVAGVVGVNPHHPLQAELAYAATSFRAMSGVLQQYEAGRAGPGETDPVLRKANGYCAVVAEYLTTEAPSVVETAGALYLAGNASAAGAYVGATFQGVVGIAAPAAIVVVAAAVVALAIYAYVTGARPGDTRSGNQVHAFPRGGSADSPILFSQEAANRYVHGMYRAVLLFRGGFVR